MERLGEHVTRVLLGVHLGDLDDAITDHTADVSLSYAIVLRNGVIDGLGGLLENASIVG